MNEELSQSVIAQSTSSTPVAPTASPKSTDSSPSTIEQPIVTPPGHAPIVRPTRSSASKPAQAIDGKTRVAIQGSFDVMGGIAEYCGGLSVSSPSLDRVVVEIAHREDEKIRVTYQGACVGHGAVRDQTASNEQSADTPFESPLSFFYSADGSFVSTAEAYALGCEQGGVAVGLALASLQTLLDAKVVPHFADGLTLSIESCLSGDVMRRKAALVAGVLKGADAGMQIECTLEDLAGIGQRVLEEVGGYPCGLASVAAPLLDRPGFLSPISSRPLGVCEALPMPSGVTILGVDTGAPDPKATEKYQHARTTSLMGGEIIARLAQAQMNAGEKWHGHLARVSIAEYVDRFRDRLPTKLKGAQFLDKFGPLPHRAATIDPKQVYKVRSRTEHHIYEDERVRQFVERLARASRTGDKQAIIEAGDLMYASHWSYGQRCGLGSCETDLLVKVLRQCGADAGVYGARISGAGAGGTVVVLMQDSESTRTAIAKAIAQYESERSFKATLQPAAESRD